MDLCNCGWQCLFPAIAAATTITLDVVTAGFVVLALDGAKKMF